ncbi:MAG: NADH-quinone oxidoreductase subunit L [candidate division Zixibacteria bacterium HGW-Zixibacteria-1]|nr:MAG: NADH-quinone oxidoreductase subunit L [candidate division Zixibacteria bacterium HGW-Zixibacteria-1]
MLENAFIIPFYPLFAFVMIIFVTRWKEKLSSYLSIGMILIALAHSIGVLIQMIGRHGEPLEMSIPFITLPSLHLELGAWFDPLTAVMLVVVTTVSSCVQIYSLGYMHGDPRWSRYFSYLSLFTFSMLGLVIANNFFMIFIFWELVGLTSYLLIGFWFEKKSASDAGKKAFITTRIGDLGFIVGLLMLGLYAGTFNYQEVFSIVKSGTLSPAILGAAGVLIFCGAVGKSAQFPLHVWLPDAMEGPTPVSALIHAATMVAAGVYLVARAMTLFAASGTASMVVAVIGLITSFMAATIALTQFDIKRVLAYSTVSQLGYMIMALGLYGYDTYNHHHTPGFYAGTFHLMTHAFFKALLFLGAGSVIHAVHTNDIREMGGLFGKMKITAITFIVASLSIAGIFPLSGFWSKDEIVAATSAHPVFMVFTLAIAFMTAFYMFRLCFMTFTGKPRDQHRYDHAHESPKSMTVPLMFLGFLSVFAGWVGLPWLGHGFASFVFHGEAYHPHANYPLMLISTVVAVSGIGLAYAMYYKKAISPDAIVEKFKPLYTLLYNKYYFDELYDIILIRPILGLTNVLWWFDANVIDGLVNFAGWITIKWADVKMWFDKWIIDGAVNGTGHVCMFFSWLFRYIQSGSFQFYTLVIIGAALEIMLFRVSLWAFYILLAAVILLALLRLAIKTNRSGRVKAEPNIEA